MVFILILIFIRVVVINDCTGVKIGHPYPPRGRLGRLFLRHDVQQLQVDYRAPMNDRILFQKAAQPR